jgi:hypothetical protein
MGTAADGGRAAGPWHRPHPRPAAHHLQLQAAALLGVAARHLRRRHLQLLHHGAVPVIDQHVALQGAVAGGGASAARAARRLRTWLQACALHAACGWGCMWWGGPYLGAGGRQEVAAGAPCKHDAPRAEVARGGREELPLRARARGAADRDALAAGPPWAHARAARLWWCRMRAPLTMPAAGRHGASPRGEQAANAGAAAPARRRAAAARRPRPPDVAPATRASCPTFLRALRGREKAQIVAVKLALPGRFWGRTVEEKTSDAWRLPHGLPCGNGPRAAAQRRRAVRAAAARCRRALCCRHTRPCPPRSVGHFTPPKRERGKERWGTCGIPNPAVLSRGKGAKGAKGSGPGPRQGRAAMPNRRRPAGWERDAPGDAAPRGVGDTQPPAAGRGARAGAQRGGSGAARPGDAQPPGRGCAARVSASDRGVWRTAGT